MSQPRRGSALEVFRVSLRLGLTSFGGPIAHIGYQRAAYVTRHRWLDEPAFAALVALCQALPGPASSQLGIAVGAVRAGYPGAVAAWIGFTLPSAIALALLGILVAGQGLPEAGPVAGAIAGLKVAAVAVVAHAVVSMARTLTPDLPRLLIAAVAGLVALLIATPLTQLGLIAAGAAAGWLLFRPSGAGTAGGPSPLIPLPGQAAASSPISARGSALLLVALVAVLAGLPLLAVATGSDAVAFVDALARAGALVFGGGHVVLPLLEAGVVGPGWVAPDAFLAGYGAAQAVPGPLFTFASYLGAVSSAGPGGALGAAFATVAIFLPGGLLVLAALPGWGAIGRRAGAAASLAGVNAAVVGILAAALIAPVGTGGITGPVEAVLAAAGVLVLWSRRLPPIAVVAACAGTMAVLAA